MKLQHPPGTKDFFPEDAAKRSHILDTWRRVSIRNGFELVDGPVFELLELYKVKSGEGIVNELFHFQDRGGRELAIRPEFTPTLARMVASRANALPKPIKWFCMPNLCRAERPQRGRLREFWQWNVDVLGSDSPIADAESILAAVDALHAFGLRPEHIRVKISHRQTVKLVLEKLGVPDEKIMPAFELLDGRDKMTAEEFSQGAAKLGLTPDRVERFDQVGRMSYPVGKLDAMARALSLEGLESMGELMALDETLRAFDIADWCEYDMGIVRGLAYYTGTVYEIHEASGAERAIAGGGRYDKLIELFDGPPTPAVGFGMGNVVLEHVLIDKGLMPTDAMPRPDVFVIALTDDAAKALPGTVRRLRLDGWHTRFSYRSSRNVGKLLKEADQCGAVRALILDDGVQSGKAKLKMLQEQGREREVPLENPMTPEPKVEAD
jgi:histidyl-tRNA synthetase